MNLITQDQYTNDQYDHPLVDQEKHAYEGGCGENSIISRVSSRQHQKSPSTRPSSSSDNDQSPIVALERRALERKIHRSLSVTRHHINIEQVIYNGHRIFEIVREAIHQRNPIDSRDIHRTSVSISHPHPSWKIEKDQPFIDDLFDWKGRDKNEREILALLLTSVK